MNTSGMMMVLVTLRLSDLQVRRKRRYRRCVRDVAGTAFNAVKRIAAHEVEEVRPGYDRR